MSRMSKYHDNLSPEERRMLLAQLLQKKRGIPDVVPLSFAQQRLWFLTQLVPDSPFYNIPLRLHLSGPLQTEALQHSLSALIHRHEILRTTFTLVEGQPKQVLAPKLVLLLSIVDLTGLTQEMRQLEEERLSLEEAQRPFDLVNGPLLRAKLLCLSPEEHVLLLVIHHIISDGWSIEVFFHELAALYSSSKEGIPSVLSPLPIQYADYAVWQRKSMRGDSLETLLAYWQQQLQGAPTVLELPFDYLRPPTQTFKGTRYAFTFPSSLLTALHNFSQREGVTLFMTLLAAFQILLYRYTGQVDFLVGSPVANRTQAETEGMIGFFVNTLVLRADFSGMPTLREVLKRVRHIALEAYDHQEMPFERIVEELQPERSLSYTPLIQVMFALQNTPLESLHFSDLVVDIQEVENKTAKFDLTLEFKETIEGLLGNIEYSTDLFERATVVRMVSHYQRILEELLANPEQRVGAFSLLTERERFQQIVEWNATQRDYPWDRCIHQLIESQVEQTPEAIAVVFEQQQLAYRELNQRANQLAHHLQKQGVGPESLVGVCMERSLELVVSLLGILKAGGAYVPLDPNYPQERIAFMLQDAQISVLLTQTHLASLVQMHTSIVLCVNEANIEEPTSVTNPVSRVGLDNIAYVIYTSGSTGKPKGAVITHRGIYNRLLWMQEKYSLTKADRVLQKTPFSFDVSVWEFFWPLLTGACLVVAHPDGHRDSSYLVKLIKEQQITTLHFVPSMLTIFLEEPGVEQCTSLKRVICSGEALPFEYQERFFARLNAELHNLYGPTEASIDVTYWHCIPRDARRIVPIGRPIANIQVYILDTHSQLVPIGVAGELCIGGVGLARGYLNRPDLTAEKFFPHPFSNETDARLYRTGDLVRYLADGAIEFLGRIDHQVKLRGFRIELGEIEALLSQYPPVREAVVQLYEKRAGDRQLVAYVVADQHHPTTNKAQLFHLPNHLRVFHMNRSETQWLYEEIFVDQSYLKHGITLKDGDCVFDIGANIGLFTLFVHEKYPNAQVYAFEPIPSVFELLHSNVVLYGLSTHLFQYGLSNQEKEAKFTFYPHWSSMSGLYADIQEDKATTRAKIHNQSELWTEHTDELLTDRFTSETITCQLRTLSAMIRENAIQQIDLLKIDVEKSELDVLGGIEEEDWQKIRQIVVEVHDRDDRLAQVVDLLKSNGYELIADQAGMLANTDLYNIYARRPSQTPSLLTMSEESASFAQLVPLLEREVVLSTKLRRFLQTKLPNYMIPSVFVLLNALPLTSNGKVDRRALPAPEGERVDEHRTIIEPRNELEAKIAHLFEDILNIRPVDITDNFFELGGHSLLAIQLISQIRRQFDQDLPLSTLFQGATPESLASILSTQFKTVNRSPLVGIQTSGSKLTFFCVHPAGGGVLCYADLARHLGLDNPFYGLEDTFPLTEEKPHNSVEDMARRYVESVLAYQSRGPYCLGGWSLGGCIAFEMARLLIEMGHEVALALLDTFAPATLSIPDDVDTLIVSWIADEIISSGKKNVSNEQQPKLLSDEDLGQLSSIEQLHYLLSLTRSMQFDLPENELEYLHHRVQLYKGHFQAHVNYRPKKIHCHRSVLFLAERYRNAPRDNSDPTLGWRDFIAEPMKIYPLSSTHRSLLKEPIVSVLAEQLKALLNTMQEN